jgi:hypothetical protein
MPGGKVEREQRRTHTWQTTSDLAWEIIGVLQNLDAKGQAKGDSVAGNAKLAISTDPRSS